MANPDPVRSICTDMQHNPTVAAETHFLTAKLSLYIATENMSLLVYAST